MEKKARQANFQPNRFRGSKARERHKFIEVIMRIHLRSVLQIFAAGLVMGLVACGGGGDSEEGSADTSAITSDTPPAAVGIYDASGKLGPLSSLDAPDLGVDLGSRNVTDTNSTQLRALSGDDLVVDLDNPAPDNQRKHALAANSVCYSTSYECQSAPPVTNIKLSAAAGRIMSTGFDWNLGQNTQAYYEVWRRKLDAGVVGPWAKVHTTPWICPGPGNVRGIRFQVGKANVKFQIGIVQFANQVNFTGRCTYPVFNEAYSAWVLSKP